MTRTFLTGVALMAMASAANASIVYNNGGPNASSGNDATAWVQAEDFTLAAATSLAGAGVYIAGFNGIGAYTGPFNYFIFANNAGTPGSVLASGTATPTITDTGTPWCCGGNAQLFRFNFASAFNAAAGATYYLGIHLNGDFTRDDLYWVTTAANATAAGVESNGGTFDNWVSNGQEHAFFLTAVPEPASWALMIAGFGMVGAATRRRVRAVTFA